MKATMARRLARTTKYKSLVVPTNVVVGLIPDTVTAVWGILLHKPMLQTSGRGFSLDKIIKGSETNKKAQSGVFAKAGKKGARLPYLPSEKHQIELASACSLTR